MIHAYEARPSQGKTVYLVHLIEVYRRKGYKVVTNIRTNVAGVRFASNWEAILDEIYDHCSEEQMDRGKEGTLKIVLDELNIYLNSRNWEKLSIDVQLMLSQHRHYGVDIIGATQSVRRVDTIFRELVQYLYSIHRLTVFSFRGLTFGFFLISEYDPDDIEVDRRERKRLRLPSLVYIDPPVFKLFSSWQRLENNLKGDMQEIVRYKVCSQGHKHKI